MNLTVVRRREGASLNHLQSNFDGAREAIPFLGPLSSNLLLIGVDRGSRHQVEASLVELGLVSRWEPGEPLVLPNAEDSGTLFLHEVGQLTQSDQLRLLRWLEQTAGRTRVVSTTPASLFVRVEAGLFNEELYYRLNTISLNVGQGSKPAGK